MLGLIDFTIDTGVEQLQSKHDEVPDRVTPDLDTSDVPTHGHQQLTLFHGYYGQYQYLPLIICEPTTKHVFSAWLRMGTLHPWVGADDDLMRVVHKLRGAGADVATHVRADSGFGVPRMMDCCEKKGFSYTFGIAGNKVLQRMAQPLVHKAAGRYQRKNQKQRLFTSFMYQAKSWPHTVRNPRDE